MPWKPSGPGDYPTLGYAALDWITENLAAPDRLDYEPFQPTQEQAEFILRLYEINPRTGKRVIRRAVWSRSRGWGKALALDTPIPTPSGWSTMGELAPGDVVFDERGVQCRVVAKSPVWDDTDCWRVRFSDGQEFTASGDHLWTLDEIYGRRSVTIDTRTLAARHRRHARNAAQYRVSSPAPLELPDAELPIDPYVLGVWLGDGDSDCGRVTSADQEVVDELTAAGYRVKYQSRYRHTVYGLMPQLRALGLLRNKHVPTAYARASAAQRLALLQGLMDTDGSIYDTGVCEFTTCSEQLAEGVGDLLAGLGVKYGVYRGPAKLRGVTVGERWRFKFTAHADLPLFRLPRKLARMRPVRASRRLYASRRVVSVEQVETVPTVCVTVDSPSSLFLAGRRMTPTHNSPVVSALAILEGLGDVVPDGWDADGQPVGKPWATVRMPLVVVAAASEAQTANAWLPLLEMLREDAPVWDNYPGLEPMGGQVNLPYGLIRPVTASPTASKGFRPVFTAMDQSEQWMPGNGGVDLARILRANAAKVGGLVVETPNAFTPGLGSVAEQSASAYFDMKMGRSRQEDGLLYDHREAPPDTQLMDRESLEWGLRVAYGDSSDHPDGCVLHDPPCPPGWAPIESLIASIWDTDTDEQTARGDYLNQITHATDSWLSQPEWAARKSHVEVRPGDVVTLGLDCSRGRVKGKPDATALIGCRVEDGHVFEVGVWEAGPDKHTWPEWSPPMPEIEAAVEDSFTRYRVVGFYADPAGVTSYVGAWEARWGARTPVKARRDHPFEWWMTGGRAVAVEKALEQFEEAVRHGEMTHDGSYLLTQHVLNARRRLVHKRLAIAKDAPGSVRKIDAAVAAVLAWQARLDAVAAGLGRARQPTVPRRIR